jgi:hypothetical protein
MYLSVYVCLKAFYITFKLEFKFESYNFRALLHWTITVRIFHGGLPYDVLPLLDINAVGLLRH